MLLGAVILTICFSAAGYAIFRQEGRTVFEVARANLAAVADIKVREIEDWRHERLMDARFFFNAAFVSREVEAYLAAPGSEPAQAAVLNWLSLLKGGDRYQEVVLFDQDLVPRLSVPDRPQEADGFDRALLAKALHTNEVVLSDLHRRSGTGGLGLDLAFAVRAPQAVLFPTTSSNLPPLGVILLRLDPRHVLYPLVQSRASPSTTEETLLVAREDDELVVLNDLRLHTNAALNLRLASGGPDSLPAWVASGERKERVGVDYRGVRVLAALRPIQGTPWFLVAKTDLREIYQPLKPRALGIAATVLAFGFAFFSGAWVRSRRGETTFLRRELSLERERSTLADRVAFLTEHARDIIILTDPEWRILEVNQSATRAYGYETSEFLRLSLEGLDSGGPDSRSVSELKQAVSSGGAVFETVHRRKDGSEFPVEISVRRAALAGRRYGFAIIRDITQRRQAEQEIERLTRLYALLSEVNQAVVRGRTLETFLEWACRAVVVQGGLKQAWVGRYDAATGVIEPVAAYGEASEYIRGLRVSIPPEPGKAGPAVAAIQQGRLSVCNDFQHDPATQAWWEAARRFGAHSVAGLPIRRDDRVWGVLVIYATEAAFFRDREIALLEEVAEDVSFALENLEREQRRLAAEESLRSSEEKLSKVFHTSPGVVAITTLEEGRILDLNESCHAVLGYRREDLIGRTTLEVGLWLTESDRDRVLSILREQGSVRNLETRLRGKSGQVLNVLMSMENLLIQGRPCVVTVVTDITARKRVETELEVRNRGLEQLLGVFQQLSMAHSREAIGEVVSRAARALADADGAAFILREGDECRYVAEDAVAPLFAGQRVPLSRCVAGWSILHRQAVVIEDVASDPRVPEEMYRSTFVKSLGIIPIRTQEPVGAIAVYCGERHPTCAQALGLLQLLADATSVALANVHLYEMVQRREEQLALALESASDGLFDLDLTTGSGDFSPQWYRMLGYVPGEFPPALSSWTRITHPEDAGRLAEALKSYLDGHSENHNLELRLRTKAGAWRWILSRGRLVKNPRTGETNRLVGTHVDITERKQAEEALRDSEERLRLALTAANQGLYDYDIPTGEIRVGAEYAIMLGYDPAEFRETAASWSERLHPADRERFAAALNDCLRGRTPLFASEFRQQTQSGDWKWILSLGKVVAWDAEGRPWRMLGTHSDITQRKQAEEEIRKLNTQLEQRVKERTAQLEEANRELEAFTYTASHDLRAPLRAVDGFARILVEDYAAHLPAEAQFFLLRVREGAKRMAQLIEDLLAFSRLGRQPLRRQAVDHGALVQQVLLDLQADQAGRRIEWVVEALPTSEGDPALLKQVWTNLISNAIKFTSRREVAHIEIRHRLQDGEGTYIVSDNGAGFSMRYAAQLFGVFHRLHRADEFPGTGVGLAIVQRIIQRHGGRVWAQSEPDKGATFFFTLGHEDERHEQARQIPAG